MPFRIRLVQWFFHASICSLFLLPSLGCSTLGGTGTDSEHFTPMVEQFNEAVRWEDYKSASLFLPNQQQKAFWDLADVFHGYLKVTDCEIRKISVQKENSSGDAILCYRYYYANDPYIRTKNVQQHWSYSEKDKGWRVVQHDLHSLMPTDQ